MLEKPHSRSIAERTFLTPAQAKQAFKRMRSLGSALASLRGSIKPSSGCFDGGCRQRLLGMTRPKSALLHEFLQTNYYSTEVDL